MKEEHFHFNILRHRSAACHMMHTAAKTMLHKHNYDVAERGRLSLSDLEDDPIELALDRLKLPALLEKCVRPTHGPVRRCVHHAIFKNLIMIFIFANGLFIAIKTQYSMDHALDDPKQDPPEVFKAFELAFCMVFTVELCLRVGSERIAFIAVASERKWNLLDLFLVILACQEQVIEAFADGSGAGGSLYFLRILRILRVVRVIRVVRVLRYFKELRTMLQQILSSFASLAWLFLLLTLILFIFGVAFMQGVVQAFEDVDSRNKLDQANPKLRKELSEWFSTVPASIVSLFKAMFGFLDVDFLYRALQKAGSVYPYLFIFFLFFTLFGVMNIVTGVFAERVASAAELDRHEMVMQEQEKTHALAEEVKSMFKLADADGSGQLGLDELKAFMKEETLTNYLKALDIECAEAETLFSILDSDFSGAIDVDEFVLGCMRHKGTARGMELAVASLEQRKLHLEVLALGHYVEHVFERLAGAVGVKNLPKFAAALELEGAVEAVPPSSGSDGL